MKLLPKAARSNRDGLGGFLLSSGLLKPGEKQTPTGPGHVMHGRGSGFFFLCPAPDSTLQSLKYPPLQKRFRYSNKVS